jgi:hypothetical protein
VRVSRLLTALLAAAAASVALAAPAGATPLPADTTGVVAGLQQQLADLTLLARVGRLVGLGACGSESSSAVFRPWGDPAQYVLAPNGDVSATGGWTFNSAVSTVAGGSPKSGGAALSLADGGQAISPVFCVAIDKPTIRLFARNTGPAGSRLAVTVLFEGLDGRVHELPVGVVAAGATWNPTPVMLLLTNLTSILAPGGSSAVAIRFTAVGLGAGAGRWQLDDLYVDPFKGH